MSTSISIHLCMYISMYWSIFIYISSYNYIIFLYLYLYLGCSLPSVTVGAWISHEPLFKRSTTKSIHFSNFLSCKNCALNRAVLVFPCVKKWCSRSCCLVFSSVQKSCSSSCFFGVGSVKIVLLRAESRGLDRVFLEFPSVQKNRALDRALWCSPPCKNRALVCESCYRQWARHKI